MIFLPSIGPREANHLYQCLQRVSTVVLITVGEDGRLARANLGGEKLLRLAGVDPDHAPDLQGLLIRPTWAELQAVHPAEGQAVFEGVINVGSDSSQCQSLIGRVLRLDRQLLIVGEYDVEDMALLNAKVLAINEQLVQAQRELARSNRDLSDSEARLNALGQTDALTGLANRRRLMEVLAQEVKRFSRYHEAFSVIMIDVDYFKAINDDFGHDVGDAVLVALADVLKRSLRDTDFVARFGGEEFMVMLPGTAIHASLAKAELLRAAIEAMPQAAMPREITASLGVAECRPGDDAATLFKRADVALYAAKRGGRNRVSVAAG